MALLQDAVVKSQLDAKMQDIVNIKDYGAYGDGAHDDTTAFNSAVAACNDVWYTDLVSANAYSLGKILFLPKGIYNLTQGSNSAVKCHIYGPEAILRKRVYSGGR